MNLLISDPQPRWIPELTVKGYVKWLRDRGMDVHEFATAYANRTDLLGYPPDLAESVREFYSAKVVA
jgi:hypothetical protein